MTVMIPEFDIICPYCSEAITVGVDAPESMRYIEDCQVCCRPIEFEVSIDYDGDIQLFVHRDDD